MQKIIDPIMLSEDGINNCVVRLTPKQAEVMQLLIEGKRDKEIARLLSIKRVTVVCHVRDACARLSAKTRVQAVAIIFQQQNKMRIENTHG